jgi:succinyl-diaminopimelate desuccinylase
MRRLFSLLVLSLFLLGAAGPSMAAAAPSSCQVLTPHLDAGARALAGAAATGAEGFAAYRRVIATAAGKSGDAGLAGRVAALAPGRPVPAAASGLASCLLRAYTNARYGDAMVRDLQEMVAFPTFAVAGRENWDAPEFVRQREWLAKKVAGLGFQFKSYDGRVDEITLPGPPPVLALLTHGDVQGVEGQRWSSPPFAAKIVDGRIVGRGTEDDKGAIVASLYAMAAVRDAGWPLGSTVRLLVANGEETSWDEVPYYLARAPMPDVTVGIDAAYPVTHAQKGYGVITIRAGVPASPTGPPGGGDWRVVRMSGGSGMSIIPERGEALLDPPGDRDAALAELTKKAAAWAAAHPPARLAATREGDLLKVTAEGRGGHSSVPESGHNALGDLTAFLATLDLRFDPWGALAMAVGIAVGTETDGASLGIAHQDAVMGALTSNLAFLREDKGQPVAEINIRVPRGITLAEIRRRIDDRAKTFTRHSGAPLTAEAELASEPHLAPAEGPLVSSLLAVWQEVTGTPGRPVAIGGGTQARLFKDGVDFGPAQSMEHYRGHGTDEYLTPDELHRIAELTVAAVWKLAGEKSPGR